MRTSTRMKASSMTTDTFTTNIIGTTMMSSRLWASPIAIHIVMKGWYTGILTIQTYIIDTPTS